MDYKLVYEGLIAKAKNRISLEEYFEVHHVVPRSLGGDDSKDNLVQLTAREHFLAHWLLWKIHRCKKTGKAFFAMSLASNGQQRSITARQYDAAKKALSVAMSGENNFWYGTTGPMGGRTHTEEFKNRHSTIMKAASEYKRGKPVSEVPGFKTGCGVPTQWGNVPAWNLGLKGNLSHSYGRKASDETRAKMRKPKAKVQCPHCGKVGGKPIMSRFHFGLCKVLKNDH